MYTVQLYHLHKLPIENQQWIFGRQIPEEDETVANCQISYNEAVVYVYILNSSP